MLKSSRILHTLLLATLILATGNTRAQTAGDETEKPGIPCLKLDRITDTDIIDNTRIVFLVGVNDYYLNTLPYPCNGLRLNDSFMYRTSINEICDVDVITVMNPVGPGYTAGPSCGLGRFVPITKEEIKELKDSLKK